MRRISAREEVHNCQNTNDRIEVNDVRHGIVLMKCRYATYIVKAVNGWSKIGNLWVGIRYSLKIRFSSRCLGMKSGVKY